MPFLLLALLALAAPPPVDAPRRPAPPPKSAPAKRAASPNSAAAPRAAPPATRANGYGGAEKNAALGELGRTAAATVRRVWPDDAPTVDAALSRAAQAIAADLAKGIELEEAARPEALRLALARAGAVSPDLAPLLVRASSRALALQRLRERLAAEPGGAPDLVGVGAEEGGGRTALVVLRAKRRVALDPFPLEVGLGTPHRLTGRLLGRLARPTLYLTAPGGTPSRLAAHVDGGEFAAVIHFAVAGRYTIEVLGDGPQGPEVAALFEVWAGERVPDAVLTPAKVAEPDDVRGKEALAARLANELRKERRRTPLRVDPALSAVARTYAEELLRTGRFAHHSPTSGALADRLRKAGYRYRGAGENLAQAPNVRQAHQSTVASPGHLSNLVDPAWTSAGFGVATGRTASGGETVVLVQVFARNE